MATCIYCGDDVRSKTEVFMDLAVCEDCRLEDSDNGTTGHGEECYSDADPGL